MDQGEDADKIQRRLVWYGVAVGGKEGGRLYHNALVPFKWGGCAAGVTGDGLTNDGISLSVCVSELPCVRWCLLSYLSLSYSPLFFCFFFFFLLLCARVCVCACVCVLASVPFTGDQSWRSTQPPISCSPSLQPTISSKHLQHPPFHQTHLLHQAHLQLLQGRT